tara:strand:- start:252 stop:539 length:288 start_codon:yes stop_codon:yes gene_type:complete
MKFFLYVTVFILFFYNKVNALNIFELTAISVGSIFVYDQYNDNSLSYENVYEKKKEVFNKHNRITKRRYYIDLNSRTKLINHLEIIESFHRRKNF